MASFWKTTDLSLITGEWQLFNINPRYVQQLLNSKALSNLAAIVDINEKLQLTKR